MEDNSTTIDPHAADNDSPVTVVAGAPTSATQTPEFSVTDDGNLVKHGGKAYVREEALHVERQRAQGYAKTLQTLEPLMPEFERFLANQKGGRDATVERATRTADSDYSEDELTGYAITRAYYDAENKPDLRRAKDDLDIMTAIADRRANRAVKPLADTTTSDRARDNVQRALGQTFVDGEPIAEEKYMRAAFDALPDHLKADDQTAQMTQVIAAGLQALDDRRLGRSRGRGREPIFREGGSGRTRDTQTESLDALDMAAAKARGKTPDQWAKMGKSIGGANFGGTVLEDI
jgi:hypothetical protein